MASFITAGNATNGLQVSSDNTGILELRTGTGSGTTAVTFSTGQRATFPSTISVGNTTPATTGAGITFPAAQSASSDANTLDDYEEGSWTGTISDGTNNATMQNNSGYYTKVGNLVTVTGYFNVSAKGSISGGLRLTGLPFTVASTTASYAAQAFGYVNSANITAGQTIGAYGEVNTTYLTLTLFNSTGGSTGLTAAQINNGFNFILSITYRAA